MRYILKAESSLPEKSMWAHNSTNPRTRKPPDVTQIPFHNQGFNSERLPTENITKPQILQPLWRQDLKRGEIQVFHYWRINVNNQCLQVTEVAWPRTHLSSISKLMHITFRHFFPKNKTIYSRDEARYTINYTLLNSVPYHNVRWPIKELH